MDLKKVTLLGAIVVSILVILGSMFAVYIAYHSNDVDSAKFWQNTLNNGFIMVLGYWIGSAASSRLKDDVISNLTVPPALIIPPLSIKDEIPIPNHPKTPK